MLWFGVLAQCAWSGFVWSVSLGLCFDLIGWLVMLRIAGLVGVLGFGFVGFAGSVWLMR